MVTAYLLDRNGHQVTVFEKQPILGGHIRTVNKNVTISAPIPNAVLECGVLEFPVKFYHFLSLMQDLEVELEAVDIGSALFLQDGRHVLSGSAIRKNFRGIQRFWEYLRLDTLYARSAGLWITTHTAQRADLRDQPLSRYLKRQCLRNCWLKLLVMYSYSTAFEWIDHFPAELVIPMLREYVFTDWVRIKGGVYSYIEKILERFQGDIHLNVDITGIYRTTDTVKISTLVGATYQFDKVVFATPPDQVLPLLGDATEAEQRRFAGWQQNQAMTVLHTDTSLYTRYGIQHFSEFDFFQTDTGWGYNAYLNQLCGISSSQSYSLAFNLDRLIAQDQILHQQEHHTPLYTVASFQSRDEIVSTNGENHTYHAGAYLGDGLHEGAIASAMQVAKLIG